MFDVINLILRVFLLSKKMNLVDFYMSKLLNYLFEK